MKKLPNGSHDFFHILSIFFLNYLIRNPQTTIALTFLTHIISGIDGVYYDPWSAKKALLAVTR